MVSKVYPDGSLWLQNQGTELEVLQHLGDADFLVKFEDSPVFKAQAKEIKNGCVRDHNIPDVVSVGWRGWGKYQAKIGNKNTQAYEVWRGILRRCYDVNAKNYGSYGGSGITVERYWHNFQNFAEWYYTQTSNFNPDKLMQFNVDKDLKGGYEYSESNCTLLPYKLNSFIQVQDCMTGDMGYIKNYRNPYNRITTTISFLGKQIFLGAFHSQKDANTYYDLGKRYVTTLLAERYLEMGLISKETSEMLKHRYGKVYSSEVQQLLSISGTLETRIQGVLEFEENLLARVKGKVNSEIYK